ncbi:hypothetical protein [Marivita sp.]|uniref:hypothetical protein n=1 Tax=Marivita sp. TaxID=2003365 RepID=UPI0025BFCCB0|nr:hypothetical protein [Marivita sp.]
MASLLAQIESRDHDRITHSADAIARKFAPEQIATPVNGYSSGQAIKRSERTDK